MEEDGTVARNDQGRPATMKEYLPRFAAENDYLVNGSTKSGAGAAEEKSPASRTIKCKADFRTNEDKVAWIKKNGFNAFSKLPLK